MLSSFENLDNIIENGGTIISNEEIAEIAPDVATAAVEQSELLSPYITCSELRKLCEGDSNLEELLRDVFLHSLRYTESVCKFERIIEEGKRFNDDDKIMADINSIRRNTHDTAVDSINILSRQLSKAGKSIDWMSRVSMQGRASYGRFAIFLGFELALEGGNY